MTTFLRLPISWISFGICLTSSILIFASSQLPLPYHFCTFLPSSLFWANKRMYNMCMCAREYILSFCVIVSVGNQRNEYILLLTYLEMEKFWIAKKTGRQIRNTHTYTRFLPFEMKKKNSALLCRTHIATGNPNVWLKTNTQTNKNTSIFSFVMH